MSDIHITPELLEAVTRGDLSPRVLAEVGWRHLLSLCPTCRESYDLWNWKRRMSEVGYEAALRVLPPLLERHSREEKEGLEAAKKDLRTLLELDHKARIARIERATTRLRGIPLVHLLLGEAKKHIPASPGEMYDLAETAEAVLLRSPRGPGYFDALARLMAYKANGLRAQGRIKDAEAPLNTARHYIRHENVTDVCVYAEVDAIEGVLRKDQRRFPEAHGLLKRSAGLYELAGEPVEAARVRFVLGILLHHRQETAAAIEVTRGALDQVHPETEPRLYLCGRYNLALFLVDGGRFEAAGEILAADATLYRQFTDAWTQLRWTWLHGRIASATLQPAKAERAFLAVRDGFLREGIGFDVAIVSLDLTLLYLREGRYAEVTQVAEAMHTVFDAQDIHREASAAVLRFQEAARAGRAAADLLELAQDVRSYL